MEAGGTHIESGRVISEAFENYRNYAGPLLAGALLVVGIAGVISGVLGASDSLLLALLGRDRLHRRGRPLHRLRGEAGAGRPGRQA